MTERQIQREIVAFLRQIGCSVWDTSQGYRRDPGGTRMTPGLPDLYVIEGPQSWTWVEVKGEKGKLSPAQQVFADECRKADIPWELWRSVDDAWKWAVEVGIVVPATSP